MVAEYHHPLIDCSISFVSCFCVYDNFSCSVCYKLSKYIYINEAYLFIGISRVEC